MRLTLPKRINSWVLDYTSVIRQAFRSISRDNINLLASGMVYSTLIAIVPCITFLSAFLSAFGALEPFLAVLSEWLFDTFGDATGNTIMSGISRFTGSAMSLGVAGLISFIITGMFLVNKIYSLVNHIFRTEPTEGTMKRLKLIVIFLIVVTVVVTFGFALSLSLHDKVYSFMGKDVQTGALTLGLRSLGQFSIVFLVFFVMITAVPNVKIKPSASISGAFLGTVLIYIASFIFTRIISYTVGYSVIYGSLASVLFVLLYIYLVWYLVVFVMEVTYVYQFRPDKNTIIGRPVSGERQIADGIDVMVEIARRFEEGKGTTALRDLSATLSMPLTEMNSIISCLESASLIIPVNTKSSVYILSRPSGKIHISDIVDAVFSSLGRTGKKRDTEGIRMADSFKKKGLQGEDPTLEEIVRIKNDNR